jgi:hypothetical protein
MQQFSEDKKHQQQRWALGGLGFALLIGFGIYLLGVEGLGDEGFVALWRIGAVVILGGKALMSLFNYVTQPTRIITLRDGALYLTDRLEQFVKFENVGAAKLIHSQILNDRLEFYNKEEPQKILLCIYDFQKFPERETLLSVLGEKLQQEVQRVDEALTQAKAQPEPGVEPSASAE